MTSLNVKLENFEEECINSIESIFDAYFLLSRDNTVLNYSIKDSLLNLYFGKESLQGKNFLKLLVSNDQKEIIEELEYRILENRPQLFETSVLLNDQAGYYNTFIFKLTNDQKLINFRNIDDQKKLEFDLAEERNTLKNIIELNPYAIEIKDLEGRHVSANKAFIDMFKSVAPPQYSIFTDPHLKKRGLLSEILKLTEGKVIKMGEHWYDVRDSAKEAGVNLEDYPSSPICHKAVAFPIFDKEGKIKNYVFMHEDITKRKLTEKKLSESEERFRSLVETTSDWIWEIDANSVFTYTSPKIEDLLGYEQEEIIGKTPLDLMPLNEAKRVEILFQTIIESDKSFKILENTNLHKDGSLVVLETSGVPILDENGKFLGYRGINRDITDRKRAEQKLKDSEAKFRDLANLLPQVICETDERGNIKFFNNNAYRVFGYTSDDLNKGLNALQLIIPEDRERVMENIKRKLSRKEVEKIGNNEFIALKKDGSTFPGLIYSNTIIHKGKFVGLRSIIIDITEQKKAEQKLKESEKKYRDLFNNTPYAIWLVDLRGKIVDCNKTMDRFMSIFKHTDLIGKSFRDVLKMFSREGDPRFENLEEVFRDRFKILLKNGHLDPIEFEISRGDGKTYWITLESAFVKIGKEQFIQLFIKDITETKLAEIELENLRKDLENRVRDRTIKLENSEKKYRKAYSRADTYKGLFTHDISNIFQTIGNSMELSQILLEEDSNKIEILENYENISQQIKRGKDLINNIRKLSEIEESEMPLVSTEIFEKLKRAIQFAKVNFQEREITINLKKEGEKLYVMANDLLLDVFENILINSVRYNKNERVEIEIRISRVRDDSKRFIKLEFKDNGIGINDNRKKLIFNKNNEKVIGSKGMGLGLSLVAKFLDLCEGKIWVEDKVKGDYTNGSNFILLLPEAEQF